jgi:4-amino-4-deoxy-L-arabinose transferase-like glycosyltransferase
VAVAALLPAAAWAYLLWRRVGDAALREFVWVNNVQRFIGGAAGKGHEQPFWYYGPALLMDLFPWSLVLPFALAAAWRFLRAPEERGGPAPAGLPAGGERDGVLYLASWFVVPLVVLSIASTKRGIYLLPIYPAAALLCGWFVDRAAAAWEASRPFRATAPLFLVLAGAAGLGSLALVLLLRVRPHDWAAPTVLVALLAPPAVGAWRALRDRAAVAAAVLGAALTGVAYLALALAVLPRVVATYATPRPLGEALARLAREGDRIVLHDFKQGMLGGPLFYAGRTFPNLRALEDLDAHLSGPRPEIGPRPMALMREGRYEAVRPRLRVPTVAARRFARPAAPLGRPDEAFVLVVPADAIGARETPAPAAVPAGDRSSR